MEKTEDKQADIGVIIGRFQLDEVHNGHLALIKEVTKNHKKIIIFLGIPSHGNTSKKYPMEYAVREKMVKKICPIAVIAPIKDVNNDDQKWSDNVDYKIKELFSWGSAKLYGGRDSFIPHYKGRWPVQEIENSIDETATEIRKEIAREIIDSRDFRKALIYAAYNNYPKVLQCVDIAPVNVKEGTILLGKKPGEDKLRFLGGHVDPTDESLEKAALRELHEEAGNNIEVGNLAYISSHLVDDPRYKNEEDSIMTALFRCEYLWGTVRGADDVEIVEWVKIFDLLEEGAIEKRIMHEHIPLMEAFLKSHNITTKKETA